jgi:hypothetical protein
MYEKIPGFLDRSYDDWPEIEIYSSILYGSEEHKRKQAEALKALGFEPQKQSDNINLKG